MTEINFYVSKEEGLEHRLAIAHRLVVLALKIKMNIHIHTDSEATNKAIDDYLWTKESNSFIPHEMITASNTDIESLRTHSPVLNENNDEKCPQKVDISHEVEPFIHCDYLINLSNQRPAFFSRFSKMAEILDNNDEIITAGRKRYSFYRDRGYNLRYHQL